MIRGKEGVIMCMLKRLRQDCVGVKVSRERVGDEDEKVIGVDRGLVMCML